LDACKGLPAEARGNLMEALRSRRGREGSEPVCETMTLEEARRCVESGIELGGHSRSHPSLARIPDAECRDEIDGGLRDLREAGFTVKRFAYPFGGPEDVGGIDGLPRRVLADMDVDLGLTTVERAVRQDEDPFLVPRKVIMPQSLPQIALKLEMLAWGK
jgi:peptidoglycan/xylan/chitin deacetylase (PgdA/CDA1 family)